MCTGFEDSTCTCNARRRGGHAAGRVASFCLEHSWPRRLSVSSAEQPPSAEAEAMPHPSIARADRRVRRADLSGRSPTSMCGSRLARLQRLDTVRARSGGQLEHCSLVCGGAPCGRATRAAGRRLLARAGPAGRTWKPSATFCGAAQDHDRAALCSPCTGRCHDGILRWCFSGLRWH